MTRADAIEFFQYLLEERMINSIDHKQRFEDNKDYYRFQEDEMTKVLNHRYIWYHTEEKSDPSSSSSTSSSSAPSVVYSDLLPLQDALSLSVTLLNYMRTCFLDVSRMCVSSRSLRDHYGHICPSNVHLVRSHPIYLRCQFATTYLQVYITFHAIANIQCEGLVCCMVFVKCMS